MTIGARLVVKLGGSHSGSPLLLRWLGAIEAASGGIVIVPGGGPFADAVREAQRTVGFGDQAAHRMALLAMMQFGLALVDLGQHCAPAESEREIEAVLLGGRRPVWSPWPMLRDAAGVAESWEVTSDSLAVWLAAKIGAAAVVLVKRAASRDAEPTVARMVQEGVVDAALPLFMARFSGDVFLAGPDDLPTRLDPAQPPGRRLRPAVPVMAELAAAPHQERGAEMDRRV